MGSKAAAKSSRARVRSYRERMRAQGLRQVQVWVPDTKRAGFAAKAHRQALLIARSSGERRDQAFVDAVAVDLDDE